MRASPVITPDETSARADGWSWCGTLVVEGQTAGRAALTPMPDHDWVAAADLALEWPRPEADFALEVAGIVRRGRLGPPPGTPAAFSEMP